MRVISLTAIIFCARLVVASTAHFELPLIMTTAQTPALSTDLRVGVGAGFSHFPLEIFSFRLGYGALFTFSPLFWHGTNEVYTSGVDVELEARTFLAYAFDGSVVSFWPFVFLAPVAGLRATKIDVFDDSDRNVRFDYGFRGGGGIKIRFGEFDLKIDSAAGFGSTGLTLRTTIMFGFGIF